MNIAHRPISFTLFVIASLIVGCGESSVVVTPNYNRPELHQTDLKRDHIRIVNVNDKRSNPSSRIGTARVGMFNKQVPYTMNGNVAEFVKNVLDTLIVGRCDQDPFVPISVSINMFEVGENMKLFSEEGYFACNLSFNYPMTPDSSGHKSVFLKQTENSVIDVTNSIEPLIYKGLAQCARTFVEGTLDKNSDMLRVSSDSAAILQTKDSVRVALVQQKQNALPETVTNVKNDRPKADELSFHYVHGSKIQTGICGSYNMLSQAEKSRLPWGLGMGLTFYDIDNKDDNITGSYISFGGKLVGKYYFSDASTTIYVGGNVGLAFGSEKVDYGYHNETNFFFGPTFEEVLGLSFNRKFSVEFGSFQLAHFGSKILPSDVGFVVGLSFGL